jgi:hypothetical protein
MQIRLQTTVAPFDDSFVKFLPVVEKAMIDHGLDPRDFTIAKDSTQFNSYPGLRQRFHDYTVSVRGKDFTVTQPTDSAFLKYFYDRCVAPEEVAPSPEHKLQGIIGRLLHWLNEPITGGTDAGE